MQLLELWREIHAQAVELSDAMARVPDECECGDPDAHLEGRCSCCASHPSAKKPLSTGESCLVIMDRLRADLNMLTKDFSVVAGTLDAAALGSQRLELRRGIFLTGADLHHLVQAFEKVSQSVAGFRRNCTLTELRGAKRHSIALREHCDKLELPSGRRRNRYSDRASYPIYRCLELSRLRSYCSSL
jgi:hypothetical protein